MKIATFNANSIRSRMPVIGAWLERHHPDVLCIQETKVQDCEFPVEAVKQLGYQAVYCGQKAYNGVALLSRKPCSDVAFGLDDEPRDESRLLAARIHNLHIINTYVPQGRDSTHEMFAYKLAWFRRLKAYFKRHFKPDDHVLWLGDLNVAREPIDVHSPEKHLQHVCFHELAREAFSDCADWGFVDLFRAHHPGEQAFTFYDYRTPNAVQRGIGWRIDYLMATPSLAARCSKVTIDLEPRLQPKPSDHTFLVGEFNLEP